MARLPDEIEINARVRIPGRELQLAYARAGGPGGQHVNKTATKVLLRWNLERSEALGTEERDRLRVRLASRLTADGDLLITSESTRDQRRNVEDALERFAETLRQALRRPKRRKKTRPSKAARERRLTQKRQRSERKRERRRPPGE